MLFWEFELNRLVVPQVYTIIAFGASMFILCYVSSVALLPPMDGTPRGLIHPYFTAELFLQLSTVVVWVMAMLISLHDLRKQKKALTRSIIQNWVAVSLAFATVITGVSGCIFYSEPFHFEYAADSERAVLRAGSPPNIFAQINGLGILFCETIWTIMGFQEFIRYLKRL